MSRLGLALVVLAATLAGAEALSYDHYLQAVLLLVALPIIGSIALFGRNTPAFWLRVLGEGALELLARAVFGLLLRGLSFLSRLV